MLNKVLKKRKGEEATEAEKKQDAGSYVPPPPTHHDGFHAKGNSTLGAARQRSIGNRMTKPSR